MSEEKKLSRKERRAKKIRNKYGSLFMELLLEEQGDPLLYPVYAEYVRCRCTARRALVSSAVLWVLFLVCSIVDLVFSISGLFLLGWMFLFWSMYFQLYSNQEYARALHSKHKFILQVLNNQVMKLAERVHELEKKGKKNGGRPRKTQRKSA